MIQCQYLRAKRAPRNALKTFEQFRNEYKLKENIHTHTHTHTIQNFEFPTKVLHNSTLNFIHFNNSAIFHYFPKVLMFNLISIYR